MEATFQRCSEIGEPDLQRATASLDGLRSFLERAVAVAVPGDGAPKVLLALARLPSCGWLREPVQIEIDGDERRTRVNVTTDSGQRVVPTATLPVAYDEFSRAVRLVPRLVDPLEVVEKDVRIVLRDRASVVIKAAPARPSSAPTRPFMQAVPAEAKRSAPPPKDKDIHNRPTRVRMEAIRLEDQPEARRDDSADIDDAWDDNKG